MEGDGGGFVEGDDGCVVFCVGVVSCFFVFFFSSRRRHTRSLRDLSSDVCSSDLANTNALVHLNVATTTSPDNDTAQCPASFADTFTYAWSIVSAPPGSRSALSTASGTATDFEIGRASCRERGSISGAVVSRTSEP